RLIFHLPLRQTEGFLRSLARMLEVELPIPDHTTLSRRLKKLGEIRFRRLTTDRPIHLLIVSTGLRIHVGRVTVLGFPCCSNRPTIRWPPSLLVEVQIASRVLNTMTRLGMPEVGPVSFQAVRSLQLEDPFHLEPLLARHGPGDRLLEFPHQRFPLLHSRVGPIGVGLGFE
ncbi:MAG: transposase, partial [Gemmatimonadetes bacterium]|nr:transposase [Gemmatimonadota bacterium]